jgi:hypothetical protein
MKNDSPLAVHPALMLLGLGQPASPEDQAEGAAPEAATSPAQPAFLLLGLQPAAPTTEPTTDPTTDGAQL